MNPIPLIGGPADKTVHKGNPDPIIIIAEARPLTQIKPGESLVESSLIKAHKYFMYYFDLSSADTAVYIHESTAVHEALQMLVARYPQQK
jgi:hypothetical protein